MMRSALSPLSGRSSSDCNPRHKRNQSAAAPGAGGVPRFGRGSGGTVRECPRFGRGSGEGLATRPAPRKPDRLAVDSSGRRNDPTKLEIAGAAVAGVGVSVRVARSRELVGCRPAGRRWWRASPVSVGRRSTGSRSRGGRRSAGRRRVRSTRRSSRSRGPTRPTARGWLRH